MKKIILVSIIIILLYFLSYIIFRQTHIEIWEKDEQAYVIFPENKIVYYIFRPATYLDEKLTDMKFHIGQHR